MSAEVRQAIADAATTVQGITAHPYYVQRTEPGQSFVRLDRIEHPNAFGAIRYWDLVVIGPQEQARAEQFLDEHSSALTEALAPVLPITRITPNRFDFGQAGILLGFAMSGHREE